jgi:hypothetical protein
MVEIDVVGKWTNNEFNEIFTISFQHKCDMISWEIFFYEDHNDIMLRELYINGRLRHDLTMESMIEGRWKTLGSIEREVLASLNMNDDQDIHVPMIITQRNINKFIDAQVTKAVNENMTKRALD